MSSGVARIHAMACPYAGYGLAPDMGSGLHRNNTVVLRDVVKGNQNPRYYTVILFSGARTGHTVTPLGKLFNPVC
jgi:hypothetical protein